MTFRSPTKTVSSKITRYQVLNTNYRCFRLHAAATTAPTLFAIADAALRSPQYLHGLLQRPICGSHFVFSEKLLNIVIHLGTAEFSC